MIRAFMSMIRIVSGISKKRSNLSKKNRRRKNKIMNRLSNFKDQEELWGLTVTDDYTRKQRQTMKKRIDRAKQQSFEEQTNSWYIWGLTQKWVMFLKTDNQTENPTVWLRPANQIYNNAYDKNGKTFMEHLFNPFRATDLFWYPLMFSKNKFVLFDTKYILQFYYVECAFTSFWQ